MVAVTMPSEAHAVFGRRVGGGAFRIDAPGGLLSAELRHRLVLALGRRARGTLRLRASMKPGTGCGSSTAALIAVFHLTGAAPASPDAFADALLRIEGATDPLMMDAPATHLWAPRQGRSLERLPPPPSVDVLGGFDGLPCRTVASDMRFADVSDLVSAWRRADGPAAYAALATASAERNHALRGGADPARLAALADHLGAHGIVAAHTGSARGLIFAPGAVPRSAASALRALGLRDVRLHRIGRSKGALRLMPVPALERPWSAR
ncbi:MAG: propanediol utilization protein [Pseudomonadota bacterium]